MAIARESITLVGMTLPAEYKVLKDYRNEEAPDEPIDITGYTIRLIVKMDKDLADSRAAFTLDATLEEPTRGLYKFQFTTKHTSLPAGVYPGEIRWWSGSTSIAADDAIPCDFEIIESMDTVV